MITIFDSFYAFRTKAALATIFILKIFCLKVEIRLRFVIEYMILKQTLLILKIFPSECS